MDEEIEQLLISVRADTQGFGRDVAVMRGQVDNVLIEGLGRAGQVLERGLLSAIRRGSLGFEDLKRIALAVMEEIAAAAIEKGLAAMGLGGDASGTSPAGGLLSALLGLPGRATGGPVNAGRPYLVGERGPELFVPQGYGRVERQGGTMGRDVRVSISIQAPASGAPTALQASSRQVARAVRRALMED